MTEKSDEIEKCEICNEPLKDDDLCLFDINLGTVHAGCCGPERETYVNLETGEPLGDDEPLPVPFPFSEVK